MEKKISEIHSITELLGHVSDHSHVFFDLDNTVLMSEHDFGSAAWEEFMIKHLVRDGVPLQEATDRAGDMWKAVQIVSKIRFVEEHTPEIIQQLQKAGHPVLAITARSPEIRAMTEKQLAFLNLEFHQVFYCGNTEKGKILQSYVERHRCSKVVMVDDTLHHLKIALEHLTIPFVGLRYGYTDAHKKNYVPDPVTLLLGKVFNHPEACKFLRNGLAK